MKGIVISFSPKHGYGFIKGAEDEVFFFHATEWKPPNTARPGDRVEFDPIITEKGSRAKNVRRKGWHTN